MNNKENFSQAVKDLLASDAEAAAQQSSPASKPVAAPTTPLHQYNIPVTKIVDEAPAGVSTIAAGTLIVGEVHSKGDLNLFGDVQGNVETKGNVTMGGKVIGNITGKDVNFTKSSVKGNISASGSVQLDEKSTVVGDIASVMMSCNGRIKGNLKIEGKAHFLNETILVGNVCAGSLVIEEGARIKGDVSTSNNSTGDMEDPFKDLQ